MRIVVYDTSLACLIQIRTLISYCDNNKDATTIIAHDISVHISSNNCFKIIDTQDVMHNFAGFYI